MGSNNMKSALNSHIKSKEHIDFIENNCNQF